MNELTVQDENTLAISDSTKELIKAGVSESALRAYQRALDNLTGWLKTHLDDAALAEYITGLHQLGKSSSTIAQIVAAVKWEAKNLNTGLQSGQSRNARWQGYTVKTKIGRGPADGLSGKMLIECAPSLNPVGH